MIAALNDEIVLVQELRTKTIAYVVTGKVDVRNVKIPQFEVETEERVGRRILREKRRNCCVRAKSETNR
nr:hypothetical protein [uncultured Bacillus sp.]